MLLSQITLDEKSHCTHGFSAYDTKSPGSLGGDLGFVRSMSTTKRRERRIRDESE
jgi:hypothetical protein